ncbi:MAG: glycosyltransferase family 4 protein [bacterium]|nr:glycosyltransferase family 4 protein [bacterium]
MSPQKKIKVLQIIECGGGAAKQVSYICNNLDRTKFDVSLVYSLREDSPDYKNTLTGTRLYYLPMVREISPVKDSISFLRLIQLLQKEQPDVLHLHSSKAGFIGRLAGRMMGVPVIIYAPRGLAFLRKDVSPYSRWLYLWLEKIASFVSKATLMAVSEDEAVEAAKIAKNIVLIKNAVDIAEIDTYQNDAKDKESIRIVTSGRISPAKDPEAFLNIMVQVKKQIEGKIPFSFVWIGDGELREKMEKDAKERGILDLLKITGWLNRKNVYPLLWQADVFVMTSLWEGLPNALLEAMAAGRPVVATDIIGNRDVVSHGETGFLAKNMNEFTDYLCLLIKDSALRKKMGINARKKIEQEFLIARMIKQIEELYQTTLKEQGIC